MPRILLFPVGKDPEVTTIASGLEPMQAIVGGYIENVDLEVGLGLICNEEGKLSGLPVNRYVPELQDVIRGPFFLSRYNAEGEATDVTVDDVTTYKEKFTRAG